MISGFPLRRYISRVYKTRTAVFSSGNYTRLNGSLGLSNSKVVSCSFWIKIDSNDAEYQELFSIGNTSELFIGRIMKLVDSGLMSPLFRDVATNDDIFMTGHTPIFAGEGWHHVLFCMDLNTATEATDKMWIDGIPQTLTQYVTSNTYTFNFNPANPRYTMGMDVQNAVFRPLYGALAEFWFDDSYIDDWKLFRTTVGTPRDLSHLPQPAIYLKGGGNAFNVNSGTGANFTTVGTLGETFFT